MNTARIIGSGNLGAGVSSGGTWVMDKRTGQWVRSVTPGQFRPSTPLIPQQSPLPSSSAVTSQRAAARRIAAERAAAQRTAAERAAARRTAAEQAAARNIAAQYARLQAMREASAANMRKKEEERRERIRQQDLARERKAAEAPPDKKAGVRAWEAYYARQGISMPASERAKTERDDQQTFYNAVAGKQYIQKQPGINPRLGISWMFSVAYSGQTMPYWEAWYDRSMSASQIAARVAADYTAEIQRRRQVQAQNIAARELWQDTGKQGPKPILSQELRPSLPAIPQAPERRSSLPPISQRRVFESVPALRRSSRARVWEELPPLRRGVS